MSSTTNIQIRLAESNDGSKVFYGLKNFFWPWEPLSIGHKIKTHTETEEALFMKMFRESHTLLAELNNENNTLAGFLMCFDNLKETTNNNEVDYSQNIPDKSSISDDIEKRQKMLDIDNFLCAIRNKCDVYTKFGVNGYLTLCILAVSPEMSGRSIGTQLFKRGFQLAQDLGYKVVCTECTGVYSQKIANKLGMECVGTIAYKDYKNEDGEQIFKPPEPHTVCKLYVKMV